MSDHSEYTSSQKKPNKTKWSATVTADDGYYPGRLNKDNGILESHISLYASAATDSRIYLLIAQYDHQHIRVTINNETVYENSRVIPCTMADTFTAEIVPDTGYYIAGTLNENAGTIFKNKELYVTKDAEALMCDVILPATKNQTITFYSMYTIQQSTSTAIKFSVPYDTMYSIEVTPDYGYTKGTCNHSELTNYVLNVDSNGFINKTDFSIKLVCAEATKNKYKITIPSSNNQTVSIITSDGAKYTANDSPVSLFYLTEYDINITPKDNTYVPGRLITPPVEINSNKPTNRSFTVIKDIDIRVTPAHLIKDGVFYLQFLDEDKEIVPFTDYIDDDWYITDNPYLLYDIEHQNKKDLYYIKFSGTNKTIYSDNDDDNNYEYYNDITGSIAPIPLPTCRVNIIQSEHQTIKVIYMGEYYTSSFDVEAGSNIRCYVFSDTGYNHGKLNKAWVTDIQEDWTVTATPATLKEKKQYKITIEYSDNQFIIVYYTDGKHPDGASSTQSFKIEEGGTITEMRVIGDSGYTAGSILLNGEEYPSGQISKVMADYTISATPAIVNLATVTIIQPNNATIHVYTPKKEGGIDHTSTFSCPVNTTFEAEVIGDSGVLPGDLGTS